MAWMAEGNREKNNCDQRDAIEHSSNTGVTQYDLASCCVQCSVSASSAESSAESSRHQEHDLEQRERDLLCGSSRRADAAQRAAQQLKELLSSFLMLLKLEQWEASATLQVLQHAQAAARAFESSERGLPFRCLVREELFVDRARCGRVVERAA
jgi:hypothetical protein